MTGIDEYNARYLPELVEALRAGSCVGLVGAGSSMACGYPGWGAFLAALEEPLLERYNPTYLSKLQKRDVRTRLDEMAGALGAEYPRIFRETFEPRDDLSAPEWIRLLFDLDLRLMLTTNYSTELEQVARRHPGEPLGRDPRVAVWHDTGRLDAALRRSGGGTELVYLHGRWDDPPAVRVDDFDRGWSRVVLGETSYRYAYEFPGDLAKRLAAVGQTSTLVVVGASLDDDDVTGVFRAVQAIAGSGADPHYVVLGLRPDQDPDAVAADPLARFGLRALFYPLAVDDDGSDDHRQIEGLLRDLSGRVVEPAVQTDPLVAATAVVDEGVGLVGEFPPAPRIVHPLPGAGLFQPRPAFQAPLSTFVTREAGGVLGLVGVGGSGKTALVRHGLDEAMDKSDGVVVWSFNEQPDVAAFLRSAAGYVLGEEVPEGWSEAQAYTELRKGWDPAKRWLLVLDGLESVQDSAAGDGETVHGTLQSNVLAQLLLWLAQAPVAARVVFTSRFLLPALDTQAAGGRVEILELDSLTRPQARGLLRARGVRGDDVLLDAVLDHYGTHALTVDHLGGVLAAYLDGDAARYPELGGDLATLGIGSTAERLRQLIAAYQGYLAAQEPGVRDTLARVVVFPRPVPAEVLERVFLNPDRAAVAGSLAGASPMQLRGYLLRLCELRILHRERDRTGRVLYATNPALRDAVRQSEGAARIGYAQAAQDALLEGAPGEQPTDPGELDDIEDLIRLCIDTDDLEQAFELYWNRLGGFTHLGWILGDYNRGARLVRRLVDATADHPSFPARRHRLLVTDLALNLKNLGRLDQALCHYQANADPSVWPDEPRQVSLTQTNYAKALVLAGLLPAAHDMAASAVDYADRAGDDSTRKKAASSLGLAVGLRGDLAAAMDHFAATRRYQNLADGNRNILYSLRAFHLQTLLLRAGRPREALALATANLAVHQRQGWVDDVAGSQIVLAEARRQLGQPRDARTALDAARHWALTVNHYETTLWCHIIAARLHHDHDDPDTARREADDGLRAATTGGWRLHQIDLHNLLAPIHLTRGDVDDALHHATEALELADHPDHDFFWGRLDAHRALADIHHHTGDVGAARHHQLQADELARTAIISDDMIAPQLPRTEPPDT